MSWQTKAFGEILDAVKAGYVSESRMSILRRMIEAAAKHASDDQIIRIAEVVHEIGCEMSAEDAERN